MVLEDRLKEHHSQEEKKKEAIIDIDIQTEMEYDDDNIHNSTISEIHDDQQQNLLNISSASNDTVIVIDSNNKKKLQKKPIDYFLPGTDKDKLKCSICSHEYKRDPFSDSNLRSHLGFKHGLYDYLFPSQIKQRKREKKSPDIPSYIKQELDTAAINCIVKDGLAFGTFRREGMKSFLDTIKPGYRGPSRQTIRKRLDKLYVEKRTSLKEKFKTIPFISLTTDLWMNSRRHHFLVLTAHYHDEDYHQLSEVISFRCFRGRHLSTRLKQFIIKEIKKLGIESKIFSITTDSGSDIKAATSSYEFGIRFSCDAHNLNRTVTTGLGLWQKTTSKKKKDPPTTNAYNEGSDDELKQSRLVDYELLFDELIDYDNDCSDSDDDDYIPTFNEDETDSDSDSGSDADDDLTLLQLEEEEHDLEQLLLNPEELKSKITVVLKKIRSLIKMINKSSILTTFVRNEIERKQIALDAATDTSDEERVKINELINDFHIRWNSTYLMLVRLLVVQQIINDITYSPTAHIGLTVKQIKKLRSLTTNHLEWELLEALANVLSPFFLATKCLSGQKYSTLSLSYWITENLFAYLTNETSDSTLENALKRLLFNKFNLYFKTNLTHEQQRAKLIAAYLDPFILNELSMEEINEAELLIMGLAKSSANGNKSTSTTNIISERTQQQSASSLTTSINSAKQSKLSIINQFRISCRSSSTDAVVAPKPEAKAKALTLKQEFSVYVSTSKCLKDFQTYWNEKKSVLPILSSYARRYSCIPTTSVASESAFSVAGYVDRKQRSSLSTTTLRYLMLLKQ